MGDPCTQESRIMRNEKDIQDLFKLHEDRQKTANAHLIATILTLVGVISTLVVAVVK